MPAARPKKKPDPTNAPTGLLSVRSTLVLLLGVLVGIGALALQIWGGTSIPDAICFSFGATASAVIFFNMMITKM